MPEAYLGGSTEKAEFWTLRPGTTVPTNARLHALQRLVGTKLNQWCALTSPDSLLSSLFVSFLLPDPSQVRATLP